MMGSRRLLPVALVGCFVAFAGAGCGAGGDGEEVDAVVALARAADRMAELNGFAFLMEHENGFTTIVRGLAMERAEGRVSGGDRLRADVRARAGPVNVNVGVVILPDDSWITNPFTAQWEREELSISQFFDPATGVTALMRELDDPHLSGVERVAGVDAYRVEATVNSNSLLLLVPEAVPDRTLLVRTWVGVGDPLVYRLEIVGAIEEGERDDLVRRLTLSEFDGDFEILPPR